MWMEIVSSAIIVPRRYDGHIDEWTENIMGHRSGTVRPYRQFVNVLSLDQLRKCSPEILFFFVPLIESM